MHRTISARPSVPDVVPEFVGAQLERILHSDEFSETPRLQEFLRYAVDETLQGRVERIKGFSIAHDVFHHDDPEDAQSTPIVRVEAGRLRRRLDDYYQREGQRDSLRIRIPKVGYVPRFDIVNMYDGNFDWKDWLHRAFREEHEAERVLRPLRELDNG